jgi:hypothetical protein
MASAVFDGLCGKGRVYVKATTYTTYLWIGYTLILVL